MSKTSRWRVGSVLLVLFCFISVTKGKDETQVMPVIHPKVFELTECWISDSQYPVVTEINLDAVAANRNQFDHSTIRKNGEWIECTDEVGHGFKRFKELNSSNGQFAVEYQSNGGGTLTTASVIEFSINRREIHRDGKPTSVQILRVLSIATK